MFPRNKKVPKDRIGVVQRKGLFVGGTHFSARFLADTEAVNKTTRVLFVVPAKVVPRATQRNRLRRRGYSAAREIIKDINNDGGNYIFFARKGARHLSYGEIKQELQHIIKQAHG